MEIEDEFEELVEEKEERKEFVLLASAILRYLITDDEEMDTLIMCKGTRLNLVTTDKAVYEALGSVKPYDGFKLNKLVKLFEVCRIKWANEKKILTDERVQELRGAALKQAKE